MSPSHNLTIRILPALRITEKINSRMASLSGAEAPTRPGQRVTALTSDAAPALLFVNAVCRVFALDAQLDEQVHYVELSDSVWAQD